MPPDELHTAAGVAALAAALADEFAAAAAHPLPVPALAERAAGAVEEWSDRAPDKARRACRAGCAHCCYMAVSVTALEALWLADRLRATYAPEELAARIERIAATSARVSALTIEARAAARVPCALLGPDGSCTVHPFRPLGCRGWTSFSAERCAAALAAGEPGHSGPCDRVALAAAGSVTEGLQRAFRAAGVDAGHYEFHAALLRALTDPAAAAKWRRGQPVFADLPRVVSERLR